MEIVVINDKKDYFGIILNLEELIYFKALFGGCSNQIASKAGFKIDNSDIYKQLYDIVGDEGYHKFTVMNNEDLDE